MATLKGLPALISAEFHKLRRKRVTWVALALVVAIPICAEVLLVWAYRRDAVLPRSAHLLLSGPVVVLVALTAATVSVIGLGRDYELGTVRAFLSRGVTRERFVISKVLATVATALAGGCAYAVSVLVTTAVGHALLSDAGLAQAAGVAVVRRALVTVAVVGLTGFVCAGVVNLALVMGRSSSMGMLAGVGYFLVDFYLCAIAAPGAGTQRYAVTCQAGLLLECWAGDRSGMIAFESLISDGGAAPGRSLLVLLLLGGGLALAAVLAFRRQDLMEKS